MTNGTWKIARNRGNAQLPLIIVIALALALVLLGKAQTSLFDRARVTVTDFMAPALEDARAPVQNFDNWVGSLGDVLDVYKENLRLKQENARLRQWHSAAVMLDERVKHYQGLLHAVPDPAMESVLARVIGRSSHPFLETLILDAGKAANVKPGQAVVDARGMIGRIFLAGQRTSWVIQLTDLNSRIPVSILPGNVQAIMAGDNSADPVLDTLSRDVMLKPGTEVVSSGDGGLIPQGLPIGTVISEGGVYRVMLFAPASTSQDVEILNFKTAPESPPAASPGDLPVTAAGLAPAAPPASPDPVARPALSPQPQAEATPARPAATGHE
jgi:rod shape-determining protein MreC